MATFKALQFQCSLAVPVVNEIKFVGFASLAASDLDERVQADPVVRLDLNEQIEFLQRFLPRHNLLLKPRMVALDPQACQPDLGTTPAAQVNVLNLPDRMRGHERQLLHAGIEVLAV